MAPADLALIIALDCSASVTFDEFNLIANGCGAALRDPEVVAGLTNGPAGASLCALLLWSGPAEHEISVDWTRLADAKTAEQFASAVEGTPRFGLGGLTAIGPALVVCEAMFAGLPAPARRRVIDVAGDGRANAGPAPGPIRDRLVVAGVTINGLCVLHDEPDLVESYTREVIGGDGAFALPCKDFAGFADAMRQKLQKEVSERGAGGSLGVASLRPAAALGNATLTQSCPLGDRPHAGPSGRRWNAPMEPDLRAELADLPRRRWWGYSLPPVLEQRFASETDAARNRQIRFWLGVALAVSWVTLALDVSTNPDVWWLALLLRACVVTPAFLVARRQLAATPSPSLAGVASVAPLVTTILVTMVMFAVSANFDILRSAIVQCIIIVWFSVLIPLRVRHALVFAVLTLALGDTINGAAARWHHSIADRPDLIVATHMIVVLSVLARVVAERETRRSFLLGLGLQIRAEELARSNARLLELSSTDPLTGLANRRSFDQALAQAWQDASQAKAPIAVMMIDIDHFKLFNDAAGHLEGDRCLTVVARAVADHVRRSDFAARFGGEEFVVLMPATDLDGAVVVAERVRTAIAALQVFHPGRSGRGFVSVSIGVAALRPDAHAVTPVALIGAADEALYAAKAAGRDRVMTAEGRTRRAEAAA